MLYLVCTGTYGISDLVLLYTCTSLMSTLGFRAVVFLAAATPTTLPTCHASSTFVPQCRGRHLRGARDMHRRRQASHAAPEQVAVNPPPGLLFDGVGEHKESMRRIKFRPKHHRILSALVLHRDLHQGQGTWDPLLSRMVACQSMGIIELRFFVPADGRCLARELVPLLCAPGPRQNIMWVESEIKKTSVLHQFYILISEWRNASPQLIFSKNEDNERAPP